MSNLCHCGKWDKVGRTSWQTEEPANAFLAKNFDRPGMLRRVTQQPNGRFITEVAYTAGNCSYCKWKASQK